MKAPKRSGAANTNDRLQSIAGIHHSEPLVRLVGRVAADGVGVIGKYGSGKKSDLHLTLVISDAYSGIYAIDGQPTIDFYPSLRNPGGVFKNMLLIKTNIYRNELPSDLKVTFNIEPPAGMNRVVFAQKLIVNARNFASYVVDYSAPKRVVGAVMVPGEYNSGSYIAGLLNSVMGYVPKMSFSGYQAPGWETPIPVSYFKGEALK